MRFICLAAAAAAAAAEEDEDGREKHPPPRASLQLWQRRWVRRRGNPEQINTGVYPRGDKEE